MTHLSDTMSQPHAVPVCSIVIVSIHGEDSLSRCLESVNTVRRHDVAVPTDVYVVGHWFDRPPDRLRHRYADVHWIPVHAPVPHMRLRGILQTRGRIIVLLEDDCTCVPGWLHTIRQVLTGDTAVIGGTVQPGPYRWPWEWAMYFYEYSPVMPIRASVHDFHLSGAHVAYHRTALMHLLRASVPESTIVQKYGWYEFFVHSGLRRLGYHGRREPQLVVRHTHFRSYRIQLRAAFHHGRAFAGIRAEQMSMGQRILRTVLAGGLPVLRILRIARRTRSNTRYLLRFVLALPWLVPLVLMWSIGEGLGFFLGPGRSLLQWR